jgi:mannose-1-phosphate guanylyltransferase/mannose-6-phosphate isomerase
MTTLSVLPVLMAGGSGTRLWPLSRAQYPKQFLVLHGNRSLFQEAAARLATIEAPDFAVGALCVVGNEEHRFLILEQLREIGLTGASVLLEPAARNTAPAMTLAALQARADGDDPVLVVTPADQTVTAPAAFGAALVEAVRAAADGAVVLLGITPDRPETGFGYIRADSAGEFGPVRLVERFVEKPNAATAERYLREGGYFWNSGMFVVRASTWLETLERFRPDIAGATRLAWQGRTTDASFVRPDADAFAKVPSESIDYAVMEPAAKAAFASRTAATAATNLDAARPGAAPPRATGLELRMLPLDAGWSDLGAWDAVWQVGDKDADGNCAVGDALVRGSRDTLVHATSRLVSVVGLADVVVIETPDAVLVTHRDRCQDVKQVVTELGQAGRTEHTVHRLVHRPWGWYDSIDAGARFQVKRIMVKPGASLSLQKHHHRAEHWIVVKGTAEVTNGEQVTLLGENQSTFIPLGQVHRLANPGKVPLEIIEVQSGSYLGEDDIVRYEDSYGRTK